MKNVGGMDRWIRFPIGLALLSLIIWVEEPWKWIGLIGLIPLITGLTQFCLINRLLGRNTCRVRP